MKQLIVSLALAASLSGAALAEGVTHRVAVHVNDNDPQVMNMALNNVANMTKYYNDQGDDLIVEVVTYGPGLHMLVDGKSPVADRIAAMSLEMENLTFAACANTMAGMKRKTGKDVVLLEEATIVPSGVVRLISLQEDGYAYIRP